MLGEPEWPSLEACRDRSSLLLFHKIHSGDVCEKDKYLTPAHSLKITWASHSAQYRRYQTYSDALKNSSPPPPPPELFHSGIVFLLRWSIPRLLRSLGHSSFQVHTYSIPGVFAQGAKHPLLDYIIICWISENKAFQRWIICAYTQILLEAWKF